MAQRQRTKARGTPPHTNNISDNKCIEILNKQLKEGRLVQNYQHDDPRNTKWKNLTLRIVELYFGQSHSNYLRLSTALGSRGAASFLDDSFYQQQHFDKIGKALGLLESFVDEIELLSDVPSNQTQGFDHGPHTNKVFIVHGHAELPKAELALLLTRLKLEPIILHEQPNQGLTLIEKLERNSDDVGYAFVLLTPDDLGGPVEIKSLEGQQLKNALQPRARQNVVFEFGTFVGLLDRSRVCCLHAGDLEIPSDLQGLVYIKFNDSINEVRSDIVRELRAVGYEIEI